MINIPGVISQEKGLKSELLLVKGLTVDFETFDKKIEVLKDVSLKIERGEVVTIVGESGSGKSTLAQAIIGVLDTPPAFVKMGEIYFDGVRIFPTDGKRVKFRGTGINMVFQEPLVSLNPVYTIRKQLLEAAEIGGIPEKGGEREKVIKNTLTELMIRDVERVLNSYPHQLSGGMRQRAAIAMAIIQRPKLVILDEPTTGLDLIVQRKIMGLLLNLRREINTSLLIITHDLAVAANMADRIYVMYAGRIVESGTRGDIIKDPLHPYSLMLRDSVPTGYKESGPLKVTEGAPPDMSSLPSGCPFHPRCPNVMDICRKNIPPLKNIGDVREVACWLYEK
ncbi:MAG: ABC transporter ATP-binding protein [Thermoplasmata archaeon]